MNWNEIEKILKNYEGLIKRISAKPLIPSFTSYYFVPTKEQREDIESELKIRAIEEIEKYKGKKEYIGQHLKGKLEIHANNYVSREIIPIEQDEIHTDYLENIEEQPPYINEKRKQIENIAETLSERQKDVINGTLNGLTNQQIATYLGIDKRAVTRHRKLAIKNIKKRLGE